MVRGKDGKAVEFGPKAHVALLDGYAFLYDARYESFHEGIQLESSLKHHQDRFQQQPELVLADQLYANRKNRDFGLFGQMALRQHGLINSDDFPN